VAGTLQDGIYHAPGERPGEHFGILFLRAAPGCSAADVGEVLRELWTLYQGLRQGHIPDLPGHSVPGGELSVLLAFGQKAFALPGARRPLPDHLRQHGQFRSPLPAGGGILLKGSGLSYANDVNQNPATEEVAIQFIARTTLAVNRAIVETWKLLHDRAATRLLLAGFYTGFQRDDGRSWLDYHDGVSNLRSQDRIRVLGIKPPPLEGDAWTEGGTYLAFLRIAVDLAVWRQRTRAEQDLLVGRDKLTGCPMASVDAAGTPQPVGGCPFAGTREVTEAGNDAFREAPGVPVALRLSHVQRANHRQGPLELPNSLRIFRQGYEFLEAVPSAPGFRTGLNFVSFQDTPERLLRMLTADKWLGGVNFGGDAQQPLPGMQELLSIRAGGVFLVPPRNDGESFPGASIFL
jgi:deferrochelatase/peroxidase EfeB